MKLCKDCIHHHWQSPWTGQEAHACHHQENIAGIDPVEGNPILEVATCIEIRRALGNTDCPAWEEKKALPTVEQPAPVAEKKQLSLSRLQERVNNL